MNSTKGEEENVIKKRIKDDHALQNKMVLDRIEKIEKTLKLRLNNNYETVRKAFLALDSDHDGFLTVEDFLRNFGDMKDLNYNDLKKLIFSRSKFNRGKISYEDFSGWVGNAIHQSEGFYFRHDSIKNPGFDKVMNRIDNEQEN